jgi:hypothetical protein
VTDEKDENPETGEMKALKRKMKEKNFILMVLDVCGLSLE